MGPFHTDSDQLNEDIRNLQILRKLCPELSIGSTAPGGFRSWTIQSISLGQYLLDHQLYDAHGSRYTGGWVFGPVSYSAIVHDVLTHSLSVSHGVSANVFQSLRIGRSSALCHLHSVHAPQGSWASRPYCGDDPRQLVPWWN